MDIHTAALYMQHGYRVRRSGDNHPAWISAEDLVFIKLTMEDLLATDWELITDGIVGYFPITYVNQNSED